MKALNMLLYTILMIVLVIPVGFFVLIGMIARLVYASLALGWRAHGDMQAKLRTMQDEKQSPPQPRPEHEYDFSNN